MSDHSLKRSLFLTILSFAAATGAFAATPAARFHSSMVWDDALHRAVLFGGSTNIDAGGTKLAYDFGDTWEWTGSRWVPVYPAHSPSARNTHAMVYDSARQRVVLFGGRVGTNTALNDTWAFDGTDWTELHPAASPSPRSLPGAAYDSARDRIVLFGGTSISVASDGTTATFGILKDTWEFDGTTWTQVLTDGPEVGKPTLVYDPIRKQTIMLGIDKAEKTLMYAWDPAALKWTPLTPSTLPACANEGVMTFRASTGTVLYTGGICSNSTGIEDTYEWNGENWTQVTLAVPAGRYLGESIAYDPDRQVVFIFGGAASNGGLNPGTYVYTDATWSSVGDSVYPAPRSLFSFVTDPKRNVIYLFGGQNGVIHFSDFWSYQNGQFRPIIEDPAPTNCTTPLGVYDTDREKLVIVCATGATWERGDAWTQYDQTKTQPPTRAFSSIAYDQALKKTVLFGGFNGDYLNQTWLYDGTTWTQVKKNLPPSRVLASMWFDPTLKKTVIYGGLGRASSNDRVTRFSDMWTFDGNGWTELKPNGGTPGQRYGAQVVVDPNTNHVLLFGGLRLDHDAKGNELQVYANDLWDWDGSKWTKLEQTTVPPQRENGGFAYDPLRNELVMFGGYSGFYLSDLWSFRNGQWRQQTEVLDRRRAAGR